MRMSSSGDGTSRSCRRRGVGGTGGGACAGLGRRVLAGLDAPVDGPLGSITGGADASAAGSVAGVADTSPLAGGAAGVGSDDVAGGVETAGSSVIDPPNMCAGSERATAKPQPQTGHTRRDAISPSAASSCSKAPTERPSHRCHTRGRQRRTLVATIEYERHQTMDISRASRGANGCADRCRRRASGAGTDHDRLGCPG